MRRSLFVPLIAVVGLAAAGCVTPPPPDPGPQLCQPGTFSTTGEEPCTPAPIGTFVDTEGATEATVCPLGTFQDEEGQTSCKAALPGTFVDVEGAASATFCPLGRFQPNSGATSCLLAPIGTYVDTIGAIAATNCPTGTTTGSEGSTSLSDCVAPPTLAVAYSNLDGVDGYDESSSDVLIAKLLDMNLDGAASNGDLVVTDKYPTNFDTSTFGNFAAKSHTVAGQAGGIPGLYVFVQDAGGSFYSWSLESKEEYRESAISAVRLSIYESSTFGSIFVQTTAPSQPDEPVSLTQTVADPTGNFIDVDIFI